MIKFTRQSVRPDGEVLYRLEKDGEVLREGITLDEVICVINRMDEERAGLSRCHAERSEEFRATCTRSGGSFAGAQDDRKRGAQDDSKKGARNDRTGEVRRGRGG